jgi:hypothetical protein
MTLTQGPTVKNGGLQAKLATSSECRNLNDVIEVKGPSCELLKISFQRTLRVPDGKRESELPPSMGTFPLYSVAEYKDNLPNSVAVKGGLFFPMYRK